MREYIVRYNEEYKDYEIGYYADIEVKTSFVIMINSLSEANANYVKLVLQERDEYRNLLIGCVDGLERIGLMCCRSPRDWGADHRDAMIWGIANGWSYNTLIEIYKPLIKTKYMEWVEIAHEHRKNAVRALKKLKREI